MLCAVPVPEIGPHAAGKAHDGDPEQRQQRGAAWAHDAPARPSCRRQVNPAQGARREAGPRGRAKGELRAVAEPVLAARMPILLALTTCYRWVSHADTNKLT